MYEYDIEIYGEIFKKKNEQYPMKYVTYVQSVVICQDSLTVLHPDAFGFDSRVDYVPQLF